MLSDEVLKGLEPFATFPLATNKDGKKFDSPCVVPPMALNSSSVDFAFELLLGVPAQMQPLLGVPYQAVQGLSLIHI